MNILTKFDGTRCAAHGCPMPGSMSQSTSGNDKWFCRFHNNIEYDSWRNVSSQLNRMFWLVSSLNKILARKSFDDWEGTYRNIQNVMRQNQRSDLLYNEEIDFGIYGWILRLDREISNSCKIR